ncbi:MAG: 16S rRNA (cytosine(1402)-N(4))-methyltransferase RsmH [Proteobacteria bacterium]|nr:MAG: 16S rRNA (cytosine(1402)-N(4))-methyltransferase RsmH [Pseudomonadota bacterium]
MTSSVSFEHITVLRDELLDSLGLTPGDYAVDCTAGGGGHTAGLLDRVGETGKVIAVDRDPWAQDVLQKRFAQEIKDGRLELIAEPFSRISEALSERGLLGRIQGLCADIGVSSPQLDAAERGFSFAKDGPLDMRMDQSQGETAADIVNGWSVPDLTKLFRDYGEDPQARRIAQAIERQRAKEPLTRTLDLSDLVASSVHYKERSRKHPATRVFQALRIEVNGELRELEALLKSVGPSLKENGRCAIISFHSLEDRLVKNAFRQLAEGHLKLIDKRLPLTAVEVDKMKAFTIIKPFPVIPGDIEQSENPRSRSAKLRVIEKRGV